MTKHHSINYIELAGGDLERTKEFYANLCGWSYVDYGPDYAAIEGAGIDGGFDRYLKANPVTNIILYSEDLEKSLGQVVIEGGEITIDPFDFPGGRRFHFRDPAGNHLAMWTEPTEKTEE